MSRYFLLIEFGHYKFSGSFWNIIFTLVVSCPLYQGRIAFFKSLWHREIQILGYRQYESLILKSITICKLRSHCLSTITTLLDFTCSSSFVASITWCPLALTHHNILLRAELSTATSYVTQLLDLTITNANIKAISLLLVNWVSLSSIF